MTEKLCCPECFGDNGLRENLIPSCETTSGTCDFCGSTGDWLIKPSELADWFEMLVNVYERNESGKSLIECMKSDWELFTHRRMVTPRATELLAEILDDGDIVLQSFIPSPNYTSEGLAQWETMRDEMMYSNRWFLDTSLDLERLRQLLDLLLAVELPQNWYRARIKTSEERFSIDMMGAPPRRNAVHGRANPAGIPCLYLGSLRETAVAEIRPHTGEVACVADFRVLNVRAVDLRSPRKLVSPFILEDTDAIGKLYSDIPLLERLGEELTRPVLPSGAPIDYIPSQYLCEFIKTCGFDGVIYRSSVSEGMNLALFDPERAEGGSVAEVSVSKVSVEVTDI